MPNVRANEQPVEGDHATPLSMVVSPLLLACASRESSSMTPMYVHCTVITMCMILIMYPGCLTEVVLQVTPRCARERCRLACRSHTGTYDHDLNLKHLCETMTILSVIVSQCLGCHLEPRYLFGRRSSVFVIISWQRRHSYGYVGAL